MCDCGCISFSPSLLLSLFKLGILGPGIEEANAVGEVTTLCPHIARAKTTITCALYRIP